LTTREQLGVMPVVTQNSQYIAV